MGRTVEQLMTPDPETVALDASLTEVAQVMRDGGTGMVPVTEGDLLQGVVTDRDIVTSAIADGRSPDATRASDVFTGGVATLWPGDDVEDAERLMRAVGVSRLPVVDGGRVVGVFSIASLVG